MTQDSRTNPFHTSLLAFALCGAVVAPAQGADGGADATTFKLRGAVSIGTTRAMDDPNPEVVNRANALAIGSFGAGNGGRNSDDPRLNYKTGDTVSSVAKGFLEADIGRSNLGLLLQVKAWDDFGLKNNAVPWGNYPSAYAANAPLSDNGFSRRASFAGVAAQEAYVYGSFSAGDLPVKFKLGKLLVNWALPSATGGALAEINPVDAPAQIRAGAFAEETKVPFSALFAQIGLSNEVSAEGFYQFKFVPNEMIGCGTYFSPIDFQAQGCNVAWVQTANAAQTSASERALLPTGGPFMRRSADHLPTHSSEYGLGLKYKSAALRTDFGLYYSLLDSRRQVPSVAKTLNPNATTPFVSGSALNPRYYLEWPEGIKTLALNFISRLPDLNVSGELSYRTNDIFRLNGSDQLAVANNPTALSPLRASINALALGADWPGYDRHKHVQLTLGAEKVLPAILAAQRTTLSAEFGWKHVPDLPDVGARRYGRADVYGIGPTNGVCAATANAKTCSIEGYVTRTAWGYRLRGTLLYTGIIDGLDLRPSLSFAKDQAGTSADTVFMEGRQAVGLGLRGDYRKTYFAEALLMRNSGGDYSMTKDKSFLNLSAGMSF